MTIQEAYNKGLDDAENKIIETLTALLNEGSSETFANPKLEHVRGRLEYAIRANMGESESCDIEKAYDYDSDDDEVVSKYVRDIVDQKNYTFPSAPNYVKTLATQMYHYHEMGRAKSNVGKAIANVIKKSREHIDNSYE